MNEVDNLKKQNLLLQKECVRLQAIILQLQDEKIDSLLQEFKANDETELSYEEGV